MSVEVRVPTTGNAGEDAVVIEVRATVGQQISQGDVVAVLETAKASVDVEAPESGTVLVVHAKEGDEVPEHSVLVILGEPGEEVHVSPESSPEAPEKSPSTASTHQAPTTVHEARRTGEGAAASPRARLLAQRNNIALDHLTGSGPGGRIIVPDVLAAKQGSAIQPAAAPTSSPIHGDEVITVPVRGARKVTAQRMTQSLQDAAQVTLNRYVPADGLQSFNTRLRAHTEANGLPKISINDMINFAVAQTLPHHPEANSEFAWEGISQYRHVNLGIAVDTGSALLVPVIRQAQALSLAELAVATRALVDRVRGGQFEMSDMEGGTFTVTNLGMFGVHWFTPVLNPPQSCILGVGAIHQPTPDSPALLPLSLTFDHRALDGAQAARALAAISDAIENIDVISALALTSH